MINTIEEYLDAIKDYSETYEECKILYDVIFNSKTGVIIELGVNSGWSTNAILFAVRDKHEKESFIPYFHSVDIVDCSIARNILTNTGLDKYWNFTVTDSRKFIKENWNKSFAKIDLLFIDTDHSYETTLEELNLYAPFLSENGVIFLHDTKSFPDGVRKALYEFLGKNKEWYYVELNTRHGFARLSRKCN